MPVMYLDESDHGEFLSVGGYYCWSRDVPRVELAWQQVKQRLNLDPAWPLKWSPQGTVQQLLKEKTGVDEARRRAAAAIAGLPIEVVAVVLQERRGTYLVLGPGVDADPEVVAWKNVHPQGGGVRHFYLRGVEFALQRFAHYAKELPLENREPCHLVLENLGWASNPGKMTKRLTAQLEKMPETDSWVIRAWIEKGAQALCEAYARWCRNGLAKPYDSLGDLQALGFESTFHECHDEWSDAMQIADFVAGCFGAFVSDLSRGKQGVAQDCARALQPRIRATGSIGFGIWGNGFVLWPPNQEIWAKAKGALA
jgi:hypothetical protein